MILTQGGCVQEDSSLKSKNLTYKDRDCPPNFVVVRANATLGTESFCVMTYEARENPLSLGQPISTPVGQPWTTITSDAAMIACQDLGEGYDLISNAEWIAMAREIEANEDNWVAGVLNRGWSAAVGSDGFANSDIAPQTGPNCLYNTAANTCGTTGPHTLKRTHYLASGAEIWDVAGNVWEWVDWEVESPTNTYTAGPTTCPGGSADFDIQTLISDCAGQSPDLGPASPAISNIASPLNLTLTSANGIGRIFNGNGGTVGRGGRWINGEGAGVFSMDLTRLPNYSSIANGFRCVYR